MPGQEFTEWTASEAAAHIAVPAAADDKYSRGVLGIVTGSAAYPGAAVLGVEAALHTGVGMVRYLGPSRPTGLVLARRPEIVTQPGRVQAWLLGSGIDAQGRGAVTRSRLMAALAEPVPVVIDAGALDLVGAASGAVVITPHFGELARMLGVGREQVAADPAGWAVRAASDLGVTVLLKGSATCIADPHGSRILVSSSNGFTATAGAGDALGGILGALVATHGDGIAGEPRMLARLAATASVIHRLAADAAGAGGPFTALELASATSRVVATLLR